MTRSLLEEHADELRARLAGLRAGIAGDPDLNALSAAAHKLRGSALVLGLDGVAVAMAAFEAACAGEAVLDAPGAGRALALAETELERAFEPDTLRPLRHDLRNDLNVVLMGSKLLEAELSSPDHTEIARSVASAAERMNARLVDLQLPERTAPPEPRRAVADAPLSVLVVDDDELVAGVVRRMLETAGARVDVVAGLGEARVAIARHEYGAAVIDRRLADGDGTELVPELLAFSTRIVLLSGDATAGVPGADVTLAKPVEASALIAAVTGRRE